MTTRIPSPMPVLFSALVLSAFASSALADCETRHDALKDRLSRQRAVVGTCRSFRPLPSSHVAIPASLSGPAAVPSATGASAAAPSSAPVSAPPALAPAPPALSAPAPTPLAATSAAARN